MYVEDRDTEGKFSEILKNPFSSFNYSGAAQLPTAYNVHQGPFKWHSAYPISIILALYSSSQAT